MNIFANMGCREDGLRLTNNLLNIGKFTCNNEERPKHW